MEVFSMDYLALKKATASMLRLMADYIDLLDVSPAVEIVDALPPDVAQVAKEVLEEENTPKADKKVIDKEAVANLLRAKINEGKRENAKAILEKYGAASISALNADDYEDVYKDLEVL